MPPLKDKKLKTESVRLKISKLLPLVVKQGNFLNANFFSFLTLFLLRRNSTTIANNGKKIIWKNGRLISYLH